MKRAALVLLPLAAGVALSFYLTSSRSRTAHPTAARANLVLITIDTLRADRLHAGFTPILDAVADGGVSFDNARAAAPLTLPSHVTIMTGVPPPAHGVRENGTDRFAGDRPTLARVLQRAGYRTAAFVGAFVLDRQFGLNDGFDVYDDRVQRETDGIVRLEAERRGEVVIDAALGWLTELQVRAGTPWFLWAHLYDPHAPYDPPAAFRQRAGGDPYNGEVAYADAQVGRLLEALRSRGLENRTVVAIAGDHGESLGEHGERTHSMLLYEAALRVPLVIRAPGSLVPGRRSTVASLGDLAPTLLRLLDLAVPAEMTGIDLLEASGERDVYSETRYPRAAGWSPLYALSGTRWKLIVSSATELYDVQRDPAERKNLASAQPAVVRDLTARLNGIREAPESGPPRSGLTSEAAERLRALGYVSASTAGPTDAGPNPADMIETWDEFRGALANLSAHRVAEALPLVRSLAERHPEAQVFQSTYARALAESGNRPAALELLRGIVKKWPQDPLLFHELAVVARESGAGGEAMRAEQAAIAIDPRDAAAHNGLGLLHIDAKRFAEAAAAFERAASLGSNNPSYWTNLGNARRETGDLGGAEQAYRRALALDAGFADAANGLGVLLVQAKRPAEAVPWFESAIAASPDFYGARLNLGIACQKDGQLERAADAYRNVLRAPARFGRERAVAAQLLKQISLQ